LKGFFVIKRLRQTLSALSKNVKLRNQPKVSLPCFGAFSALEKSPKLDLFGIGRRFFWVGGCLKKRNQPKVSRAIERVTTALRQSSVYFYIKILTFF